MADLKSLLRFKSHQLDQKRRALAALYKERETIEQEKITYEQNLNKEREALNEAQTGGIDIDAQVIYMRYAENVKKQIALCEARLAKMDVRIQKGQDLMREAFAELKKIEIIHERRQDEIVQEQKKKEDLEMDEIGIDQFHRKKKED